MDTFYIITNYQKDPDLETAQAIQQYLEKKGKTCYIQSNEAGDNGGAYKYTDASRVPDEVECVLVIGGRHTAAGGQGSGGAAASAARHQHGNARIPRGDRPEKYLSGTGEADHGRV